MSVPASDVRRRAPLTVRVATWSAAHPRLVIALWLVATLGSFALGLVGGGTRTVSATSPGERARTEAARATATFNASGTSEPSQRLLLLVARSGGTFADPAAAAVVRDAASRLRGLRTAEGGADAPVFAEVIDPLGVPAAFGLVSPDGTAARIVARVMGDGATVERKLRGVPALIEELRRDHPGEEILVLNSSLLNDEISEVVNEDLDGSLRLTIPITFAILLLAFGAVVAAIVPLVLAVTALLAAFGFVALYSQLVAAVSPYATQLVVLIGLAVAVDYSLFMITRFRAERARGRDDTTAIRIASSTAGRAVFFSGLAVMISIAGLFLLDEEIFRSMALGTISVVLVSVLGSLTFLPATLRLLGSRLDALRLPFLGRRGEEGSRIWSGVVRRVMARPLVATLAAAGLLLLLAAPVTRLHLGQSDLSSFPRSLEGVRALDLMNARWPAGSTLSMDVVVTRADRPETRAALERFRAAALAIPGVSEPVTASTSRDGTVAMLSFTLAGTQNDEANRRVVRTVRAETAPAVFGTLAGVQVLVGGDVARSLDTTARYTGAMPLVFGFVLALSFVILLLAFRSVVIPVKAILLNLLATAATYGVLVLVFQEGWFAGALGVRPGAIESFVPLMIFTILFGLSMDYHLFILTRIKEARDRGLPSGEAVAQGIAITSGTITSAAAIMVAVFAVFVTLQLTVIKQLGLGLAVAVLVDATIIRVVLLPATMRLLGEWNWWLPPFLRWLPRVTIEGDAEEASEEARTAPGVTAPGSPLDAGALDAGARAS